ncbi:MAG: Spy/CpxP family protein refolding chaperone [bacterium]
MKRSVGLALTAVLVLGIVGTAFSKPFLFNTQPLYPKINITKLLNLTDEQIGKIKALREEYYTKIQDARKKLQDAVFSLEQLMLDKKVDQSLVNDKKKEIQDLAKQLSDLYNEYWDKLKAILTPEQLSKLSHRAFGPEFWGRGFRYRFWWPKW